VPPGFQLAAVDGYRSRHARPCSRSPVDSAPSPFAADAGGLTPVLYEGPRDAAAVTASAWDYYYHYPLPYGPSAANSDSPSLNRSITSPVGYLPVTGLRTW